MRTAEQQISDAIAFAARKHRGQVRKHSNAPYIVHPLKVVELLGLWGIDKQKHAHVWTAAVLNDVVEDCGVQPQSIKFGFGKQVRDLVNELTFRHRRPGEHHDEWRAAKKEFVESFALKSLDAVVIKIADRLCNTGDYIKANRFDYAEKYFRQAKPIFDAAYGNAERIAERFGDEAFVRIHEDIVYGKHILGVRWDDEESA